VKPLISAAIFAAAVVGAASAADLPTATPVQPVSLALGTPDQPASPALAIPDQPASSALVTPVQPGPTPPATPAQPAPSKPSCFESVWDYLKTSVRDCPLSYGPFTLYGNIDLGAGYSLWGAPVGPAADKPNFFIQRNSRNVHWLWSPNGQSTSVVGIRLAQKLGDEWELIGVVEAGFNPYSLELINGPRSLADNNLRALLNQRTQFDSSRAGQWDNSQGFVGISNPVYGTLTFGRTNTLVQSAIGTFDPVQSIAFSQIGFSAIYAGLGAGPTNRTNTAVTYRLTYQGFRFAFQAQAGGYDLGNAATSNYQLQVGTDIGKLTFDAIGGFAQNAVTLSSLGGAAVPAGFDPSSNLRATLSNTGGFALFARYNLKPFRLFLGYIYSRTTNPSDDFPFGLPTIASGISVPAGFVTSNNFNVPRILNTVWTGVRYAVRPNIDLAAGVYWEHQNDFLPGPQVCTGSGTQTSSTRCAGNRWSYSFMVDYRPVNRISLYGGVMVSTVSGGLASGFLHTQNVDPTVGIRFRF
jgi:predicted porin